ncbi:hypothetical protein [Muricauda sp. MAR_2010_75]|uniref:hypothetical protein n=1 Tax=Allomuricauda sp. MAR_2010_75 TaxID=1250232 RepID=UPI00055B2AF8|nr:hypothetical protein [Muricauda sp. MAR_2010_75]
MCCTKLIEDFQSVLCAYKKKANLNREITPTAVIMTKDDIDSNMTASKDGVYYYGILTIGKDTTMDMVLDGDCDFSLVGNRQIIEVFRNVKNIVGDNYYFRGWAFKIQ